jgi:peptide methionine sulfoxide reductase msrA/msrB
MKKTVSALLAVLLLAGCVSSAQGGSRMTAHNDYTVPDGQSVIYLAGGCFWGTEKLFAQIDGVTDTTVGYANGTILNPTYELVCAGNTGYKETVRVTYDPAVTNLETILGAYFTVIDPTVRNKQGNDLGTQYQTGVYYSDGESQRIAAKVMDAERQKHASFQVELGPLVNFWPAEEYHQDYLKKHPNGYCHISDAEIEKAKAVKLDPIGWQNPDDETLKKKLSDLSYNVTQKEGTEAPFSSEYWNSTEPGIYVDIVTGEPLFSSSDKYESSCGWPSFDKGIVSDDQFQLRTDYKIGVARTEVKSSAGNHLGHKFENDPESPNGTRYCIDGAALKFIPYAEMDAQGYGDYKQYVKQ